MADLSKFWDRQRAIAQAEYDQKSTLAREMIVTHFPEDTEGEQLRGIISHFSGDPRAAISIMGILAQVGLMAMAVEEFTTGESA
jgi:hypothetical protein